MDNDDDVMIMYDSFRYHLMCEESNSFLSLLLQDIDTEGPSDECTDNISCLDFIRFEFPTGNVCVCVCVCDLLVTTFCAGSQCTVCGSDLICHETGRRLNPLLLFNGHHPGLIITFQSNRKGRSCGFHFLATCVKKEYFESSDCIVPPQFIPPTNPPPFPIDFGKRVYNSFHIINYPYIALSVKTMMSLYSSQNKGLHV